MTTPLPERLVQLHSECAQLRIRTAALAEKFDTLAKRRLPATTKLNVQTARAALLEADRAFESALVAFLG
jgi:hypothetical protein